MCYRQVSMLPLSLDGSQGKMLAVVEQWAGQSGCHADNTGMYVFLLVFKLALDATVLCLCWRRLHTSLLSVAGLYVVLADAALVSSLTAVWLLEPARNLPSTCFLLAHASAAYAVLPLPTLSLGMLDYLLCNEHVGGRGAFRRAARNLALVSSLWVLAVVYSLRTTGTDLMEIEYNGGRALVCEVQGSTVINYFCMELFLVVLFALVPHWSKLAAWLREANRLSDEREAPRERPKSDVVFHDAEFHDTGFHDNKGDEEDEEYVPMETVRRPSLFLSFTLAFASVWIPYLIISVVCLLVDFRIPAYIAVNLLWLECGNSLLIGVVFWLKGDSLGPYNHLPDDICSWRIYWYVSRGTAKYQLDLSTAFHKPSEKDGHPLLHL